MDLKRNFLKKAKQGTVIVLAAGSIFGAIAINETKSVKADEKVTAGVSTILADHKNAKVSASLAANTEISVSENEDQTTETNEWSNRLMTSVEDYMNVRATASKDAAVVGKLRKGDVADIVSKDGDWYQISSGNVNGYVNKEFVVTGDEAKALADKVCETVATSKSSGLRVRKSADANAAVITSLYQGQKVTVKTESSSKDWVCVSLKSGEGYVNASYVDVAQNFGKAITIAEEQAALKAAAEKKANEEAKKAEAAKAKTTNDASSNENASGNSAYQINTSADAQTLMAAIIQAEAGNQPYEGQVAVGSVIMNRLNRGYGSSVHSVIFARGQFYPATSAKIARIISNGPKASCMQAAADALNGADMVNGCTSYRPVRSGRSGIVIGGHVFF